MNKRNYQKELEKTLVRIKEGAEGDGARPSLFLHSCCAPCSSYVLEYLSQYFSITVFYYNPNISPEEEYEERVSEQERLIRELNEEGIKAGRRSGSFPDPTSRNGSTRR